MSSLSEITKTFRNLIHIDINEPGDKLQSVLYINHILIEFSNRAVASDYNGVIRDTIVRQININLAFLTEILRDRHKTQCDPEHIPASVLQLVDKITHQLRFLTDSVI